MIDVEQDEADLEKVFGVTIVNTEYLYVTAEDNSKDAILDAIEAGSFTHVCTEDSKIVSIREIKG